MYEDSKGISSLERTTNISEENPQASSSDVGNNTSHQSQKEFKQQEFKQQEFNTNHLQNPKYLRQDSFDLHGTNEQGAHLISLIMVDRTLRCFLQIVSNQQDDNTVQLQRKAKYELLLLKKVYAYFQQLKTQEFIPDEFILDEFILGASKKIEHKDTKYSEVQFFLSLYEILVGSFSHLFVNKDIHLVLDECNEKDLKCVMNRQFHTYLEKMYNDIHQYVVYYIQSKCVPTSDKYTPQAYHNDVYQMIDIPGYLEQYIRQETTVQETTQKERIKKERIKKERIKEEKTQKTTIIEALSCIVDYFIDDSSLVYEADAKTNTEKTNTEKTNTERTNNKTMVQTDTVVLQAYCEEVTFLCSALSFWHGKAKAMGYSLTAMKTVQAEKLLSFDIHNALDKEAKRPLLCNFLLHLTKNTIKNTTEKNVHQKRSKQVDASQETEFGPKNLFISLLSFRDGFYNHLRFAYEAFIIDVESIIKEVIQALASEYITSLSSIHSQQLNSIQFGSTEEKSSDKKSSDKAKKQNRLICSIQSHSIFPFTTEIQKFLVNSSYLFDSKYLAEATTRKHDGLSQEHNIANSLGFEQGIYTRESICQSIKSVLQTKIQNIMEKRAKRSPKKIIQSSSNKPSSKVLTKKNFKKKKIKKGLHRLRYRKRKKISSFSNSVLQTSLKQFDTLLEACSYIKISVSEIHQSINHLYVRDHNVSVGKTFVPNHNQPPTNKYHYEEEPLLEVVLTARWKVLSEKEKQKIEKQKRETLEKSKIRCIFSSMKNPISLGNFSCLYEKALDIVHHRTVLLIGAFGEKYLCDSFSILFHVNHMNMYLDDRTMWKKILYGPFEERSVFGKHRTIHSDLKKMRANALQRTHTLQKMDINRFEGWFQHYFNATCFGLIIEKADGLLLYENPFSTWVLPDSLDPLFVTDVCSNQLLTSHSPLDNDSQSDQFLQKNNTSNLEKPSFSKIRTFFVDGGYIYDLKENVILFIRKR